MIQRHVTQRLSNRITIDARLAGMSVGDVDTIFAGVSVGVSITCGFDVHAGQP